MADTVEELRIQLTANLEPIKNLNKEIANTKNAIATLTLTGKEGTKNFDHFNQRLKSLQTIQADLKTKLGATSNAFTMLKDSVANFGTALVGVGILAFVNKIRDLELESARFKVALDSFTTSNFRGDIKLAEQQLEAFRVATARTVNDKSLVQMSNQASDLGISLHDQTILFALAEKSADKYGTSIEESFQRVVYATDGQVKGLKAVGIQKEVYEAIVKKLASAHGQEIDKLDAETQKQIRLQAVIEASNMTYQDAINVQQDEADKLEANKVAVDNLGLSWGGLVKFMFPAVEAIMNLPGELTTVINAFNEWDGIVKGTLTDLIGLGEQANKPITIDINFRTNIADLPNDFWSVFYGMDFRLPGKTKPLTAKEGTRSKGETGKTGKSPTREEIDAIEESLGKVAQKLGAIQPQINEFFGARGAFGLSGMAQKGKFESSFSVKFGEAGDIEGTTNTMLQDFEGMLNNTNSMLQNMGLMETGMGRIVQMIMGTINNLSSTMQLGQSIFNFVRSFIPVPGVIGNEGGGGGHADSFNPNIINPTSMNMNPVILISNNIDGVTFTARYVNPAQAFLESKSV